MQNKPLVRQMVVVAVPGLSEHLFSSGLEQVPALSRTLARRLPLLCSVRASVVWLIPHVWSMQTVKFDLGALVKLTIGTATHAAAWCRFHRGKYNCMRHKVYAHASSSMCRTCCYLVGPFRPLRRHLRDVTCA